MHLISLALLALLAPLSHALPSRPFPNFFSTFVPSNPTHNCTHPKTFHDPWHLTSLSLFRPYPNITSFVPAQLSFTFSDPNDRLELKTSCGGPADGDGSVYNECVDGRVGWRWFREGDFEGDSVPGVGDHEEGEEWWQTDEGRVLEVRRGWFDRCLGPPPYGAGIAFGRNSPNWTTLTTEVGVLYTATEMYVPVTSMIA